MPAEMGFQFFRTVGCRLSAKLCPIFPDIARRVHAGRTYAFSSHRDAGPPKPTFDPHRYSSFHPLHDPLAAKCEGLFWRAGGLRHLKMPKARGSEVTLDASRTWPEGASRVAFSERNHGNAFTRTISGGLLGATWLRDLSYVGAFEKARRHHLVKPYTELHIIVSPATRQMCGLDHMPRHRPPIVTALLQPCVNSRLG
jgi:hypothetical protein